MKVHLFRQFYLEQLQNESTNRLLKLIKSIIGGVIRCYDSKKNGKSSLRMAIY